MLEINVTGLFLYVNQIVHFVTRAKNEMFSDEIVLYKFDPVTKGHF